MGIICESWILIWIFFLIISKLEYHLMTRDYRKIEIVLGMKKISGTFWNLIVGFLNKNSELLPAFSW